MKNNGKVKISAKKGLAICLIFCLFHVGFSIPYLVTGWAVEFWGVICFAASAFALVCLLGMRACLIIDTQNRIIIRKGFFRTDYLAFDQIWYVEKKNAFLHRELRIIGVDGKCFDRTPIALFKENYISPDNLIAYFATGGYNHALLISSKRLERKQGRISKITLCIISAFELGILSFGYISELQNQPTYPVTDIKFYSYAVFWVLVAVALITLIGLSVKNKYHAVTDFFAMVLFFSFLPAVVIGGFATPEDYYVSATSDFENYDDIIEQWKNPMHFPTEIRGEVVDFSYYYKYYWDSVEEVYLEVRYDEEEFERIYAEHPTKETSYFGEQYEEVNLANEYFNVDDDSDDIYISHAYLEKIIFDRENNTIIYYFLTVTDPFEIKDCHLAKRFGIDLLDYEKYIDEKEKNEN